MLSESGPDIVDPVVTDLNYETFRDDAKVSLILEEIREKLHKKFPDADFSESSALYEMACQFVYREILLRARINDICRKLLQKLKEIQSAKRKPFGLMQYYTDEAVNFSGVRLPDGSTVGIRDATGAKKPGGIIELSILADSDSGNPPDQLIEEFRNYINRRDKKVWNDTIEVARISTVGVEVKVTARPVYGTQIDKEKIKKNFIEIWERTNRLGKGRTRSWITSKFHSENVDEIIVQEIVLVKDNVRTVLAPDQNIQIDPTEWAYLIKDEIRVNTIDWQID